MTHRRFSLVLTLLCGLAALALAASASASTPVPSASSTAPTATSPLNGTSNEDCFRCHAQSGQPNKTIDVNGEQKSIYVNRELYEASRHGKLACTSCHLRFKPGPHDASQTAGWVETAKLTACNDCHADVFQMYKGSFHGSLVFGESNGKAPMCADCHVAHNIVPPGTPEFRASIDPLCARCHPEQLKTYLDSYHGKAYYLGSTKTAVCTDCHGGHKILPPSDPHSSVNKNNLVATCSQCHPGANENFAGFMVHVDPQNPRSSFAVWTFWILYVMLIAVVFSFGFVHTGLYIYRGFKDGLYKRDH